MRDKTEECSRAAIVITSTDVRLAEADLRALDGWIADQPEPKPSRAEAMAHALRDWLIGQGRIRIAEDLPEGLH